MSMKKIIQSFKKNELQSILNKLNDVQYRSSWTKSRLVERVLEYDGEKILSKLTVEELKSALRVLGAPSAGKKQILLERLKLKIKLISNRSTESTNKHQEIDSILSFQKKLLTNLGVEEPWNPIDEMQIGLFRFPKDTMITLIYNSEYSSSHDSYDPVAVHLNTFSETMLRRVLAWKLMPDNVELDPESEDYSGVISGVLYSFIRQSGDYQDTYTDTQTYIECTTTDRAILSSIDNILLSSEIVVHLSIGKLTIPTSNILKGFRVTNQVLRNHCLDGFDLRGCDFSGAVFDNVTLSKAIYDSFTQWPEDFDYQNSGAIGPNANLTEADLQGMNLRGLDLSETDLTGADLQEADLSFADLTFSKLIGADLSGANLTRAKLSCADLSSSQLNDASLCAVELDYASLNNADLKNADLGESNLCDTDFSDANLNGVRFVFGYYNNATKWPEGFDINHKGAEAVEDFE